MGFPFIWARQRPIKLIILVMLSKKPMSGIDIIKEIEKLSFGFWKPSPGTIYPLLKSLLEEGLIKRIGENNKKIYTLTEKGKKLAKEWAVFLPAGDIESVVSHLESYINYLEEYKAEYGLPDDISVKVKELLERMKKIVE
ncbi:MAG: PadR family transcriptional regulator [Thermoproteales archaeon]|nr:PadR family transcriptional regulator [Thermoproteales archaeon]